MLEPERSIANKALEVDARNAFFKAFDLDPLRNAPIQDVIAAAQEEESVAIEEDSPEFVKPSFDDSQPEVMADRDIFKGDNQNQPIFVSATLDETGRQKQSDVRPRDTVKTVVKEQNKRPPAYDVRPKKQPSTDVPDSTVEAPKQQPKEKPDNFGDEPKVLPQGPDQSPPDQKTDDEKLNERDSKRQLEQQKKQDAKDAQGPREPKFQQSMPWAFRDPGGFSVSPVDNTITSRPQDSSQDSAMMMDQLADTSENTAQLLSAAISRIIDALLYLHSEVEKHNEILDRSFGG